MFDEAKDRGADDGHEQNYYEPYLVAFRFIGVS
jgi:hypothetical protein